MIIKNRTQINADFQDFCNIAREENSVYLRMNHVYMVRQRPIILKKY